LDLLSLADTAAERAAEYLRTVERPHDPETWSRKGARDFVTHVDRTAEALIGEILSDASPGSRILGEELSPGGPADPIDGLVWVIDPLDGTTNFLHGYPVYSVSIAAAVDGELQAAVIIDVPRGISYRATTGGGATANGAAVRVSTVTMPAYALIGTGFPFKQLDWLPRYQRQFSRVLELASGIRRTGSAALDLAAVAAGQLDGFWELMLAPWDMAAGILLIREAGGLATDLAGNKPETRHAAVVAGNPAVYHWLMDLVAGAGNPEAVVADGGATS